MERKKLIYIQYAVIFVLIIVFGITNFLIKTSDVWRSKIPRYEYRTISPKDLMGMMDRNNELIIIDTRLAEDFKSGHIKGAINLPSTNLKMTEKALRKEREKEIVIYSEDGERSKATSEILSNLGFSKIRNLDGGIKGWINSGGAAIK